MDFTKSIAKLYIEGHFVGTAWLINLEFAITAAHCIEDKYTQKNITLKFYNQKELVVTFIAKDSALDAALIKINNPQTTYKRLEIGRRLFASTVTNWKAHGYPDVINDRFNAGITITGNVTNHKIQFDYGSVIQLFCSQSNEAINLEEANLRGISGAPVMMGDEQKVIGILRYAPLEFAEKILIATPIEDIVEAFQVHLPTDLHIFDTKEEQEAFAKLDNDFGFDLSFDDFDFEEDEKQKPIELKEFQKKIYSIFDDASITRFSDYNRLSTQEKLGINTDILGYMTALEGEPDSLLNLDHVNTRFGNRQVMSEAIQKRKDPWGTLHRKSAVYAAHAIISIAPIRQYNDPTAPNDANITNRDITLLLQHRSLIELGKMSIVPEVVKTIDNNYTERTVFNIKKLETTQVDLNDITLRKKFFHSGKMLKPSGTIVLNSPHSGGLVLEDIMEIIEAKHPDMYDYFQTHIKNLMRDINPEDDTHSLKRALGAVDEGIQELDVKYETAKRHYEKSASGILAIGLHSMSSQVATFVNDAFSNSKLSSMVSFIPNTAPIPDEVRNSPFFVPWLIHHKGKGNG